MTESNKTLSLVKIITLVGITVACALRFFQFKCSYSITDERTAFFTDSAILSIIALAVLLLCAIAVVALCVKNKKMYGELDFKQNPISGSGALVALISLLPSLPYTFGYVNGGAVLEEAKSAGEFMLPLLIANIIMAAGMLVFIVSLFTGNNIIRKVSPISYIPVLWGIVFIGFNYVHNTLFVNKTENYFVVAASVSFIFFFIAAAKNYAGFGDASRVKPMVVYSSLAAMTGVSYGLSDVLMKLAALERLKYVDFTISCIFLGIGLFALTVLVSYKFIEQPKPEKAPVKENKQ